MPKVDWGLSSGVIEDYDRESGFKPYTGKTPENGIYQFKVVKLVRVAGTKKKNPQLRASLRLEPRDKSEKKFKGYPMMKFMVVANTTPFQYVPFLDALGVTEREFRTKTLIDEDGNVKRIGSWKNDGETLVMGQLQDNKGENADKYPKEIGWIGAIDDSTDDDDDDDDEEYDDDDAEDDDEEEDEY